MGFWGMTAGKIYQFPDLFQFDSIMPRKLSYWSSGRKSSVGPLDILDQVVSGPRIEIAREI
jgi:hypothetical protein